MADIYFNESGMNHLISHMAGVEDAVDGESEEIKYRAESMLAGHRKTGQTHIEIDKDGTDATVSMVGEGAVSIEFGHFHNFSGEYVIGLYILSAASGLLS